MTGRAGGYISSRVLIGRGTGPHDACPWAIENRLHLMLDVCFGEKGSMMRKDNAPQNLSQLTSAA